MKDTCRHASWRKNHISTGGNCFFHETVVIFMWTLSKWNTLNTKWGVSLGLSNDLEIVYWEIQTQLLALVRGVN